MLKAIKNFRQAGFFFQKDRDPICVADCDVELTQYMITAGGNKDWPLLIKVEKELARLLRQTYRSDEGDEILRRLKGIEVTLDGGDGDE